MKTASLLRKRRTERSEQKHPHEIMKKAICRQYGRGTAAVALAVLLLTTGTVTSAGTARAQKDGVYTNAFRDNWEVSFGAEGMSFFSGREKGTGLSKNPFKDFRTSLGAAASVTKWFTPQIGLRTKASGYWGKAFSINGDGTPEKETVRFYSFQEQVMVNLTNIIWGYRQARRWDLIPYAGAGFVRIASHNENSLGASLGVRNTLRIGSHVKLHLDAGVSFAGENYRSAGLRTVMGKYRWYSLEAGLTFSLGRRTWTTAGSRYAAQSPQLYPVSGRKARKAAGSLADAEYTHITAQGPVPEGMALVSRGHVRMGIGDRDSLWDAQTPLRDISVDDFWMDRTEVTNAQYRAFIDDVKERLVMSMVTDSTSLYFGDRTGAEESLYRTNAVTGEKTLDGGRLLFSYETYDRLESMRKEYREGVPVTKDTAYIDNGRIIRQRLTRPHTSEYDFVNTYITQIYPDTTVWVNDFPGADNGLYARYYFSHPDYKDYPVVGVTWEQAMAYCAWRTQKMMEEMGDAYGDTQPFRLPTEAEWEYAARGNGQDTFPWEEAQAGQGRAMFKANFMAAEGDYTRDGNIITSRVGIFPANGNGLYDMAGNVAEWTMTPYTVRGVDGTSNINPYLEDKDNTVRSVRGGSWKDPESHIRSAWRQKEYKDTPRSYIGFRCVRPIASKPSEKAVVVITGRKR